jgi:carbamoyl-phosphate synthase large subunit
MKKILFSGAGGSIFPYMFEVLEKKYEVYVMDADEKVKYMYPNKRVYIVPKVNNTNFENEISKIILDNNIDFYVPLIDEEIIKAIKISKKLGIKVLSPSENFVKLCLNKYNLMNLLNEKKISTIKTKYMNLYNDEFNYPIFLKPNVGRGSRGIRKINNKEEKEAYFILEKYKKNEVLVQPYIEGVEYTVSVTVNNLNEIIAIIPKLVFTKEGITKHAQSIKNDLIEKKCKEIVKKLKPCGSFNVQLKLINNEIFIFEINPRFSTTLVLSVASGVNEIDLVIQNYNKNNVEYIDNFNEVKLIRRWENLFYE